MQSNIVPFAFKDSLVRVVKRENDGDEPWFVGRDVCAVLQIKNESQALARLDADEREDGVSITDPIGREQTVIVVSEAGVFRLIFTSRRPEAEEFKRWLAHDVLPALRKHGFYAVPGSALPDTSQPENAGVLVHRFPNEPLSSWISAASFVSRHYGRQAGRKYFEALWLLPAEGDAGVVTRAIEEGELCLQHLLDHVPAGTMQRGQWSVAALVEAAMDDDPLAALDLRACGVAVFSDLDGFLVSNTAKALIEIYRGSPWEKYAWSRTLRSLPGVNGIGRHNKARFAGEQTRGTFVPVRYLALAGKLAS